MIRVIDIETTGTDPTSAAVVEIASVDVTADGAIINEQDDYVCPPHPIPPEASAVHHILDEDVAGMPTLLEVIPSFRGADAYVAHNADFERAFIGDHLGQATWVCTYKCALRLWPDLKSHSNQSLRYQLGIVKPFGIDRRDLIAHRALSDAIVTAALFVEMIKHAKWVDMVQWSAEPALHTRFSFGKHRGERYDAHLDYCEWMLGQATMDEGAKFSARYWLGKQREAA
jgi:exodeoxyribonuclease X